MFLSRIKRNARRLTIVGLLAIGLVVLPMTPAERHARANEDCDDCMALYQACLEICPPQPPGESNCPFICYIDYTACLARCELNAQR